MQGLATRGSRASVLGLKGLRGLRVGFKLDEKAHTYVLGL